MAENIIEDREGNHWTADEYALHRGKFYDAIEFADLLVNVFNVRGYDRMQELWHLRDCAQKPQSFPEGADINDFL